LIFASPEPIGVRRLASILNLDGTTVRSMLGELRDHYASRGIILEEISKGFQFRSHPDNAPILRDIFNLKPLKISKAALEALAIIAYRQPITRAEAEQIRGVDCGGVFKYLFEKNLVRVIGRKEEPGRPIIYGTTKVFLELFGLKALADLPALHEFSELWEENQQLVDDEMPPDESSKTATVRPPEAGREVVSVEASESETAADPDSEIESVSADEEVSTDGVDTVEETLPEEAQPEEALPEKEEAQPEADDDEGELEND
jgi:segregation and condensation protein B